MRYNFLSREHVAATVDTPEKRLRCVCLVDIIEDLEAFDKESYPHVHQRLLSTVRFLRSLLKAEEEDQLAAEARNQIWEPMNLVALAALIPLSTTEADATHEPFPLLAWDLIVARTLCGASKHSKFKLNVERVYQGVLRFTEGCAAHLKGQYASHDPPDLADSDATSLLPAVIASQGDLQEQVAVVLDVAGAEHV
ncbi:hypothetical protein BCV69DRAFT_282563, partial [Microstroma glucosiphilum]